MDIKPTYELAHLLFGSGAMILRPMPKRIVRRKARPKAMAQAKAEAQGGEFPPEVAQRAASLLHELSQPLTAVASFSNAAVRLVRAAPTPDERLASAVTHIAEQIVRAAEVLDDLRALVAQEERPTTPSAPRLNEAAEEGLARAVLGLAAEAIVVCDAQGRIVRASRAAEQLCGRDPLLAPFDGLFSLHLVLPRGPTAPKGVAAAALQGEALHEVPASLVRPDGSRADLVVNAAPLRRSTGEITGCVITMADLSELRWVEEKLRESREEARMRAQELQAALDAAGEAVFITREVDGRRVEGNMAYHELFRIPLGASPSKGGVRAMRNGQELASEELPAQVAARGAEVRGYAFELVFDDGEVRHVLSNASPLTDEQGRPNGSVTALADVTEAKRTEESLRLNERALKRLTDAAPDVLGRVDPELCLTFVNSAVTRVTGKAVAECLGKHLAEVGFPGAFSKALDVAFREVFATREPREVSLCAETPGGSLALRVRAEPELGPSGAVDAVHFVARDVGELGRAEEALREADRRKNDFLALLSHELRNPLSPIRNSLFILDRAVSGSEQARRARAVIDRQVGQLTRLVDDLLDVTRLAQGKVQLRLQRLELGSLLRRTAEDHRSAFAAAGVELEVLLTKDPVWIEADAARLGQVVGSLLQNAVKFTGKGGQVTLAMSDDVAAKTAVISVRDTGVGLAPEVLGRLFQPIERLGAPLDRSRGGLGLGLALVKGLVELHGGSVAAHSEGLGKGVEFVARLPVAVEVEDGIVKAPGSAEATRRRRRVLIIEDNLDVADSLKEALQYGQHEVEVARNGLEGLAKARAFHPDVVLCDIGLPGMDGYEIARAFRGDDELKRVLLVALSGYALPEDLQRAQEAGFERHLAKPPNLEKLEALLAQHVEEGVS